MQVNLYGQVSDMTPITQVATRQRLAIFENAAQSHGVLDRGTRTGAIGTAGCFSFYPGKNLGALGDRGAISSNDPVRLAHYRRLRDCGQATKYDHVELGLNARLDTIQASFLAVKLPHLDRWSACRAAVATQYDEGLVGVGDIVVPARQVGSTHVFHLYVVQTAHRDALQAFLATSQVATGIHYPRAIHQHPVRPPAIRARCVPGWGAPGAAVPHPSRLPGHVRVASDRGTRRSAGVLQWQPS